MVALALFPVLHRLMHDPGDDPELARLVAESFVDDMDAALRDIGVSDTRVPKRMKTLYGSFAGRIDGLSRGARRGRRGARGGDRAQCLPGGAGGARMCAALAGYLQGRRRGDAARPILAALRRGEVPFPEPRDAEAAAHERASLSRISSRVDRIPAGGKHFRIEADEEERARACRGARHRRRCGADGGARRAPARRATPSASRGTLTAAVVQTDVVTLEPVAPGCRRGDRRDARAGRGRRRRPGAAAIPTGGRRRTRDVYRNGRDRPRRHRRASIWRSGSTPIRARRASTFPGHVEDDSPAEVSPFAALAAPEARPGIDGAAPACALAMRGARGMFRPPARRATA